MANKKYKLANSDYWETSGVYDLTEGKTQRQINAALKGAITSINNQLAYVNTGSFYDIVKTGIYYVGSSVSNKPANTRGVYYLSSPVGNNSNMLGYYIADTTPKQIFTVLCTNGSFTVKTLAEEKSIANSQVYKAGDTITKYFAQVAGRIVMAKNAVYITLNLDKPIDATSVTVTWNTTNANFYATSPELLSQIVSDGYDVTTLLDTSGSITVVSFKNNQIKITIPFNTTLSVVNNSTGFTGLVEVELDIAFS